LFDNNKSAEYNLGTSKGHTVNEIIKLVEEITSKKIKTHTAQRREGDPPRLIANCNKIKEQLGWEAEKNIRDIIKSAYEWEFKRNS